MKNALITRFLNFVTEDDWLHKRWRAPLLFSSAEDLDVLKIPLVRDTSKQVDPNWRKNQRWVLLSSLGPLECRPCVFWSKPQGEAMAMTTWLPLKTRLFAMRVGPEHIWVDTVNEYRMVRKPSFYDPYGHDQPLILGYSEMKIFVDSVGKATFV